MIFRLAVAFATAALAGCLRAQSGENVLLVVNDSSNVSRQIAEYYVRKRGIPLANVCHVRVPADENIDRDQYARRIEAPVAACLAKAQLTEKVLYLVTTLGVPLRITGADAESGAVDSELCLLYGKMRGARYPVRGGVPNPYFGKRSLPFRDPRIPIYMVTRLAGYDFGDVRGIIDRSLAATNRGKVVIDQSAAGGDGDRWLKEAARLIPPDRLIFDETKTVLYGQKEVIAYAAWGSNDKNRKQRMVGFQWLPGAIANEYVSTNGRTFQRPPEDWTIGAWRDPPRLFWAGSPQTLTPDYIREGATGASGHVDEPYLQACPRPQILLPAYLGGRNLAESYYLAIPMLSWQNIVVGDPLCKLK